MNNKKVTSSAEMRTPLGNTIINLPTSPFSTTKTHIMFINNHTLVQCTAMSCTVTQKMNLPNIIIGERGIKIEAVEKNTLEMESTKQLLDIKFIFDCKDKDITPDTLHMFFFRKEES